jgi:hypothetical protein
VKGDISYVTEWFGNPSTSITPDMNFFIIWSYLREFHLRKRKINFPQRCNTRRKHTEVVGDFFGAD